MTKAWNSGKSVGPKKAFTVDQVGMIKQLLAQGILKKKRGFKSAQRFRRKHESEVIRDLALFSMAIDAMLRSCDLLALRLQDLLYSDGEYKREFFVRQQKTGTRVKINLSESTIQALANHVDENVGDSFDHLFPITHRHYTRLVKKWARMIHLADGDYSTHSLRRTKITHIYKKTNNLRACQRLLGHKSVASTGTYLQVEDEEASNLAREFEI